MKSVELFSGAGGLALGIHLAGFAHQLLIEANDDACDTLNENKNREAVPGIANWPVVHDRVERVNLGGLQRIDLVAAGIPCQPFSNGGKRRGLEDERNMLPMFARAVATVRPRAFLLENVSGLINGRLAGHMEYVLLQLAHPWHSPSGGQPWNEHLQDLRRIQDDERGQAGNYKVRFRVLNAADYGVPQIRRRVFIVGFRCDLEINWDFPSASHSRKALLEKRLADHIEEPLISSNGKDPWVTLSDAIDDLPPLGSGRATAIQHVLIPGARSYEGHTGCLLGWPGKSLKAGVHGVGGGENMMRYEDGKVRYLTVRECARLQTFPDAWVFKGAQSSITRQLGNAVPVSLAATMACSVREALERLR